MENFVIKYANNKMDRIEKDGNISDAEKLQRQRRITKATFNYEFGYATLDETMRTIADA